MISNNIATQATPNMTVNRRSIWFIRSHVHYALLDAPRPILFTNTILPLLACKQSVDKSFNSITILWEYPYFLLHKIYSAFSSASIVRRQKPLFGVKCAISGNNHFFAFFISSWYVDAIWPRWELAIGLAFSESKMAANLQHSVYLSVYFVLDTVEWWCWCQNVCCSWWGIQWCSYFVNLEPT